MENQELESWNGLSKQKMEYNNAVQSTDFQLKLSILHLFTIITGSLDLGLSISTTQSQFYLVRNQ